MPAQNKNLGVYGSVSLSSLTLTAANESLRAKPATLASVPVLQRYFLTATFPQSEIWTPVGISYVITTGITVTDAVIQLMKNGVAPNGPSATAAANGAATLPIAAAGANEIFVPFSDYTFLAADAGGDAWSVKVTTTSTAGIATSRLIYANRTIVAIEGLPL